MITHRRIPIVESSQPGGARGTVQGIADLAGFGASDVYRAGLVVTELATNLVKHASSGGEMLARIVARHPVAEIEIVAIDRGPGISDVARAMTDGHSTAGSPGTGLGAVTRLADDFDLHSQPGLGTVILARLRAERRVHPPSHLLETGGVCVPKDGEEVCGDAWQVHHQPTGAIAMVADGLGHGLQAAEAAAAALGAVDAARFSGSANALQEMHAAIRHTRGAAAAVAEISPEAGVVRFSGVGNISASVCHDATVRQAVSHNGTLGHEARLFREYTYPWPSGSLMVMASDGLASHWTMSAYRGLWHRHPTVTAAVLYRDHSRQRDDVTVVVLKEKEQR